jgi:hypothetical protein
MIEPLPTEEIFAKHGLFDITFDWPTTFNSDVDHTLKFNPTSVHTITNRVSGWGKLRPVEAYPTFTQDPSFDEVRFYWTPISDPAAMARFRRQAQIIALDTIPMPGDASRSKSFSPGPSSSSFFKDRRHPRYGLDKEIIAWWEDDHGLWLVTLMERVDTKDLVQAWGEIFGMGDRAQEGRELVDGQHKHVRKDKSKASGMACYGEACEVLLQVVDCMMVSPVTDRADVRSCIARSCLF